MEAISRRTFMSSGGALAVSSCLGQTTQSVPSQPLRIGGRPALCRLTALSSHTLRITLAETREDFRQIDGSPVLVRREWPAPLAVLQSIDPDSSIHWGSRVLRFNAWPLAVSLYGAGQKPLQRIAVDQNGDSFTFPTGNAPLFGLGEGGRQFDRRGATYAMRHGQHMPDLLVTGARMPVPWVLSAEGWGVFIHKPFGQISLQEDQAVFRRWDSESALPLDVFLVATSTPALALKEYCSITGFPHLPPIWALGYQQSHRTLQNRAEVLGEADMFRQKQLPCDVLIYLGTGFCPSGWNTGHGSFTFNPDVFSDPSRMINRLHQENFRVVLHVVNAPENLHGRVSDTGAAAADAGDAAAYWQKHLPVARQGVDGWWPDEGDALNPVACLLRNRMYWEGAQQEHPNLRPYTLNRNGYAGMQRYGWLWSGDIRSTWQTLAAQIPVGLNTSLSGMPFWGTDTGGFVTTAELTGELFVRWFQFSTFCPLFRSHGRTWKLRLPWGWNTGEYGPKEISVYGGTASLPSLQELHNAAVEPICRKYLDLRYRLLPYTYSAVHEAHETGLPLMRPLCLSQPQDPDAISRGDEYLWGRDLLVAPVTEKGASIRRLYLPRGTWYDFWTLKIDTGGKEIDKAVDLETLPLFVQAGAIIPLGPTKQYATQTVKAPITLRIYSGRDGEFIYYDDDGVSFNYRCGDFVKIRILWNEQRRELSLAPLHTRPPNSLHSIAFVAHLIPGTQHIQIRYEGKPLTVRF